MLQLIENGLIIPTTVIKAIDGQKTFFVSNISGIHKWEVI